MINSTARLAILALTGVINLVLMVLALLMVCIEFTVHYTSVLLGQVALWVSESGIVDEMIVYLVERPWEVNTVPNYRELFRDLLD